MQIHFLSEFSVCCHLDILLPWKHDVTTSCLHPTQFFQYILRNFFLEENQFSITCHLKIQHLISRKFINEHKEQFTIKECITGLSRVRRNISD